MIKLNDSDYIRISEAAYKELIFHNCRRFPINPEHFFYPDFDIVITSIQNYAKKTGKDSDLFLPVGCTRDGYVYRNAMPGLDLILYNEQVLSERVRFTIAHEIGHVRLKHKMIGKKEETEAHLFASQLLSSDILLYKLKSIGNILTPAIIAALCNISISAATIKFDDYQKCKMFHTKYDISLLNQFDRYIQYCCKPKRLDILDILFE